MLTNKIFNASALHVYVVDLLRRLKAILGEYRQASYKPKPSSMGRKEDTT